MVALNIVNGTNGKPAASEALKAAIDDVPGLDGQLIFGFPIISGADGAHRSDAVLISRERGVIVFDLVEGTSLEGYEERQDLTFNRLQQKLLGFKELVRRRDLRVQITPVTFAPRVPAAVMPTSSDDYLVANRDSLKAVLTGIWAPDQSEELYDRTLSAIQNISTVRKARAPRTVKFSHSRGGKLQDLEDSIATLDSVQSKAVIETVQGVQRIRGLAGSGKTIVLALKAAYLHAQHPEWRIAVTFNTRSLKDQFRRLITAFTLENGGEEPDWSRLRIVNSWGAPGRPDRAGMYYEFCRSRGVEYLDFGSAKSKFGRDEAFAGACSAALTAAAAAGPPPAPMYDVILVDEAQDLPASFLRLCYAMLGEPHRLVYAYDELQTLSGHGVPPAEEIFGFDEFGHPRVTFDRVTGTSEATNDLVLEKCYRNSRPVLVSAHALGFGVYRPAPKPGKPGLVQMFDQPSLWTDIGYTIAHGSLTAGDAVTLQRTPDTSPLFLEAHSETDDLISFIEFKSKAAQDEWVAQAIAKNLEEEELRHNDIMVINTDPLTTRANLGPIRKLLLEAGIPNHLTGVDADEDLFFLTGTDSVAFTGIFRAKGNEAGMVYVVNAEECQSSAYNLARVRNRLFTAITRSKAWVRVLGVGPQMAALKAEFDAVHHNNFTLSFTYPGPAELAEMAITYRDMTPQAEVRREAREQSVAELVRDFENGDLYPEDLSPELLERLRQLLARRPDGGA